MHDEERLERFGYKQELNRKMGTFANFALSFSIISILTGAVSLYGYGLQHGGPIEMTLGWPLVSLMTTLVAISLAELASAYPTAGALYYWASVLGGRRIGWATAWFNTLGQVAIIAGIDYVFAEFVCDGLGLPHGGLLAVYALVLLSHGVLNHVGIQVVDWCNEISAWYHLAATVAIVAVLLVVAPHQPTRFLLSGPVTLGAHSTLLGAFLIGLLQAQWTLTGYDASAHAAEETIGADNAAPRGILSSVLISAVAGYVMLIAITLSIRDLGAASGASNAFKFVVETALPGRLGQILFWMVIPAMWFCGLSAVTSNSRMLYAFARDGGVPLSNALRRIDPRFKTPATAVWTCVAIAFLLAVWSRAFNVIVSISTIGLYASYGIPIACAWLAGPRCERGPFHLGRASQWIRAGAVAWILFISVLFVLPPNELTGYTFGVLLLMLILYDQFWAKHHFAGPLSLRNR